MTSVESNTATSETWAIWSRTNMPQAVIAEMNRQRLPFITSGLFPIPVPELPGLHYMYPGSIYMNPLLNATRALSSLEAKRSRSA